LPVFEGKEREDPEYFVSGLDRFRMFREGAYKIVRMNDGDWELYDIIKDPTELENLAGSNTEKVKELSGHYDRISKQWEQVPDVP
jgi:arylsulfatase